MVLAESTKGRERLPWRTFLLAIEGVFTFRVWMLATLGVYLATLGGWALQTRSSVSQAPEFRTPWLACERAPIGLPSPQVLAVTAFEGPVTPWRSVTLPWWRAAFERSLDPRTRLSLAALGLWRVAVWGIFGAAIARVAAGRMTLRDMPTISSALSYAWKHWHWQVAPPLALLSLAGLIALGVMVYGLVLTPGVWGSVIALGMPLAVVFAVISVWLAVVLSFSWPLMWASLAVERPDPFDAASCALAYLTQRPVQLTFYVLVALSVATPVGALVELTAGATMALLSGVTSDLTGLAAKINEFWVDLLIRTLPSVFYAAYFWFATVAIYLLLRRDVDGKQVDGFHEGEAASA